MRIGKRHSHKLTAPKFKWVPSDAALDKLFKDLANYTAEQTPRRTK